MSETGTNPDGSERSRLDQLPRVAALTTPAQSGGPAETGKQGEFLPDMKGWKLNPAFSGWLMGYPQAWTEAGLRSIQKHSRSRKGRRVVSPCSEDTGTP